MTADNQDEREPIESPTGLDEILGRWVWLTEAGRVADITVTLWVRGLIVSGRIVRMKEYLEGVASMWDAADSNFGDVFRTLAEPLPDLDPDAELPEDHGIPEFIHLRDARSILGITSAPSEGIWWRGSLASVDGWCFGQMSVGEAQIVSR
jgi:hypothetical protein